MTLQSTLALAGGSIKSRRETCRQFRPRQQIGTETSGRREVGIPSILHALTIREIFLSQDQFRLPGDKLPDNRREV